MKKLIYLFLIVTLISCDIYHKEISLEITYTNGQTEVVRFSSDSAFDIPLNSYDFYLEDTCLDSKEFYVNICGVRSYKVIKSKIQKL